MKKPTMKKLTLDVDSLRVESFEPSSAQRREGGTVRAHEFTNDLDCWQLPGDQFTRGDSCLRTCDYTCDDYSCDHTCMGPTCFAETRICWTEPPYC